MTTRNFTNTAQPISLSAAVNSSAVVLPVASTAGYPAPYFTLAISRGQADEEVVLCTAMTATTFTVVRGYDGTPAAAHPVGAVVEPTVSAIDFREANDHVTDASGGSHTALTAHANDPNGTSHTGLFHNSYYVGSGDLMTASGSGALLRVPIGADGRVLTVASGLPSWQPLPTPNNELAYLYSYSYDAGTFIGGFYDVLGLSVTFTVPAGATAEVHGRLSSISYLGTGGVTYFSITDGANTAQRVSVQTGYQGGIDTQDVYERIITPGTYTRKLMLQCTGGGCALNVNPQNYGYGAFIRVTK